MVECKDAKCPVHGELKVRGDIITGTVVSTKPTNTAIIERIIMQKNPKYERYMKKKARIAVHNPACLNVKVKDVVEAGECRKLSKTKSFVIIKKISGEME